MFRAIDRKHDRSIVILDPDWQGSPLEELRAAGARDELVCPICRAPVLVKAGLIKRRHFAHQNIADCPLQRESAELLAARDMLYTWLRSKYDNASLEISPDDLMVPRPFDAYVQNDQGRRFGYWVIDRGLRDRDDMLAAHRSQKLQVHWLFLKQMLKPVERRPRQARLSTTERDFATRCRFAQPYGTPLSLQYVDAQAQVLTTLRGLRPYEPPATFQFERRIDTPLAKVMISPRSGEFVHPGEYERLRRWLQVEAERKRAALEQARREQERRRQKREAAQHEQERRRRLREAERRVDPAPQETDRPNGDRDQADETQVHESRQPAHDDDWYADPSPDEARADEDADVDEDVYDEQDDGGDDGDEDVTDEQDEEDGFWNRPERQAACELCGTSTPEQDWIVYDGKTRTCKCRACVRRIEEQRKREDD